MDSKKEVKTIKDSVQIDTVPFRKIKATYYNPTARQCDKTPLITGSGYKINLKKLKNKTINIVAVSRDLLNIYPYGSEIYVHQPVHLRGFWKVEDTMNKRFTKKIDFLVYDKLKVDSVHISI
jgi:3D (Asp-Asp-Asp) domain-containing protein